MKKKRNYPRELVISFKKFANDMAITDGQLFVRLLMVAAALIGYIAWQFWGERQLRDINTATRTLNELNAALTFEKANLMKETRQSNLSERLGVAKLEGGRILPVKIVIPTDSIIAEP